MGTVVGSLSGLRAISAHELRPRCALSETLAGEMSGAQRRRFAASRRPSCLIRVWVARPACLECLDATACVAPLTGVRDPPSSRARPMRTSAGA